MHNYNSAQTGPFACGRSHNNMFAQLNSEENCCFANCSYFQLCFTSIGKSKYRGTRAGAVQQRKRNEYCRKRAVANKFMVLMDAIFAKERE